MATQMEEFEASTQLLVQKVEQLITKISAMVGTEDEQAAAHAADALAAKNAAQAAATAANDTLVAIQALDANQIVIDVAQVQGQVHAQSVHRVGELADRNPNETVSIIRQWLAEPA